MGAGVGSKNWDEAGKCLRDRKGSRLFSTYVTRKMQHADDQGAKVLPASRITESSYSVGWVRRALRIGELGTLVPGRRAGVFGLALSLPYDGKQMAGTYLQDRGPWF